MDYDIIPQTPGSFCWVELGTSKPDSAKDFYQKLFGWASADLPIGPDEFYTMFKVDNRDIAGAYKQGTMEQGIPPHWNAYVYVMNADEIAAKVTALGGKILAEPFDAMEAGRMAILQDPDGAVFHIWQPKKHEGTRFKNRPGTFCWIELLAHNDVKAREFYSQLFGWTSKVEMMETGSYTIFMKDGVQVAGLMRMPSEWSSMPPVWGTYFAVSDCDASASLVSSLGGKVLVQPRDIPQVGRFAVLQDPQGAIFSIITMLK
jgi:uncharacterized protein